MKLFYVIVSLTAFFIIQRSTGAVTDDGCKKAPDSGVCFMLFLAWHYDEKSQECREFIYRGCGGNENRFPTEEECYRKCKEKLVNLEPPLNVTVGLKMSDRVYLYWYPPTTYTLYVTNTTEGDAQYQSIDLLKPPYAFRAKRSIGVDDVGKKSTDDSSDQSGTKNTTSLNTNTTKTDPKTNEVTDNVTVTKTNSTKSDTNTTQTDDDKNKNTTPNPAVEQPGTTESTVEFINGSAVNVSEYVGKTKVPFHLAKLKHFVVQIIDVLSGNTVINITVNGSTYDVEIKPLKPLTMYKAIVSAVYLTNSSIPSQPVDFQTLQDPNTTRRCYCDPFGTVGGPQECNPSIGKFCPCKVNRAGLFCELCGHGYYRTGRSLPCHKCPCDRQSSTGSCHFVEGYLRCMSCREQYAGNLCHKCGNGYYRDMKTRTCIKCEGCHNIMPGLICDPFSGHCTNCYYNTTGMRCEKCDEGYKGDPANNISCTLASEVTKATSLTRPAAGTIAAIVIGIIVLLSGVAAFIIYKRKYNFPAHKPFWTIEFKEDHEDVNFSAVPEDELERQRDDLKFYDDPQEKKRNKKLPPYSQLREDC